MQSFRMGFVSEPAAGSASAVVRLAQGTAPSPVRGGSGEHVPCEREGLSNARDWRATQVIGS